MKKIIFAGAVLAVSSLASYGQVVPVNPDPQPFGTAAKDAILDTFGIGRWWEASSTDTGFKRLRDQPRDETIGFVLYTHDNGILKMTAQLYPLKEGESMVTYLDLDFGSGWVNVASTNVTYPGWFSQYRIEDWDNTQDVPYRVRHKASAAYNESSYEGLIRHDPVEKDTVVLAALGCIGKNYMDDKVELVAAIQEEDPDVIFFYGDQYYVNYEHCAAWLEFGRWAKELFRNRPAIVIMDDHDYSFGNLWGAGGIESPSRGDGAGGFYWDPRYINMIESAMTSHLPDPYDPTPVERGIGVYYTRMRVGGIDFALLEDRKWKSGYKHPDNWVYGDDKITDTSLDTLTLDKPGLVMLGQRQLDFIDDWAQDWTGAEMKTVLSQTTFACVPHMHGSITGRQVANLDANGWPQTPRNNALRAMRRAKALHVCGDQHMASVVKYGIDEFGDAAYAFTIAATYNSIFYRLWHPESEMAGPNPRPGSPLPWTGDFLDGFQNRISMMAYANPVAADGSTKPSKETRRDGWGIVRYYKPERKATLESWENYDKSAEAMVLPAAVAPLAEPVAMAATIGTQAGVVAVVGSSPAENADVLTGFESADTAQQVVKYNNGGTGRTLAGQSFTLSALGAGEAYKLTYIYLKSATNEDFAQMNGNMEIKVFSGTSGVALGSFSYDIASFDSNGLGNNDLAANEWVEFSLGTGLELSAGGMYSFLIAYTDYSAARENEWGFRRDNDAADYAGGGGYYASSVSLDWENDPWSSVIARNETEDQMFYVAGEVIPDSSTPPPSTNETVTVTGHWQHPGWPITVNMSDNDGRTVTHVLPEMTFSGMTDPVVQVVRESDGEILYTQRIKGNVWTPEVYAAGIYTVKVGMDRPEQQTFSGITAIPSTSNDIHSVTISM